MRTLIAAALLAACTASNAAELPRDIVGVELGAALSVPKCGFRFGRGKDACVDRPMVPRDSHDPNAEFLEMKLPQERAGFYRSAILLVIGGRVERVQLMTRGLDWQHDVLATLVEKYGEPHTIETKSLQNGYGASFDVIEARWGTDSISVIFDGAFGSIRYGRVWVQTPAATAFDEAADEAARAREPRL